MSLSTIDRRTFVKMASIGILTTISSSSIAETYEIPKRPLGKNGGDVPLLGLNGNHLKYIPFKQEAIRIVETAIDLGVSVIDFSYNEEEERTIEILRDIIPNKRRENIFFTFNYQGNDTVNAQKNLDDTLLSLNTDSIDLWQFNNSRDNLEPEKLYAEERGIAFAENVKRLGKVRFTGLTVSDHQIDDLRKALNTDYPWDSVQMPLNVWDTHFHRYEKEILPTLDIKQTGVLASNPFRAGNIQRVASLSRQESLSYVLNLPISSVICPIPSIERLYLLVKIVSEFKPLTDAERLAILNKSKPVVSVGKE